MNSNFWQDKRVFVTGHTGFKGAWLCLWLQSLGARVTGYALPPPSEPNLFELANVAAGMCSVIGNVSDSSALKTAVDKAQPEIVLHLAAQALVRKSYQIPAETYATNVMGTVHILESIRQCASVKAALIVSSDKCYDNPNTGAAFTETDAIGGLDPYSSSKGCVELVTASYRNAYFQQPATAAIASARAGNVIGGGDWAEDRLIPDMVKAIFAGKPVNVRNAGAVRPWQHVLEALGGYLLLAEELVKQGKACAGPWNFGPAPDATQNVGWLAHRFTQSWRQAVTLNLHTPQTDLHEAAFLQLDCSKARQQLGWQPQWTLEKAIIATAEWYQAYFNDKNMHDFSLSQIKQYERDWQAQPFNADGVAA